MTYTYTYVLMELSQTAYNEIAAKMRAAGYDHAFGVIGEIDMHGIAVHGPEQHAGEDVQL